MSTLDATQDEAEYVCFNCALPECDESEAGCLYRIARPLSRPLKRKPDRDPSASWRKRHSQGKICPLCGVGITNKALTCRRCAPKLRRNA